MLIEPVTLDGQHARLEPMSLAHVPALWRAGAHDEIGGIYPTPCAPRRRCRATLRPNWPNKRPV